MRSNRIHRWVLDLISKCYPRFYSRRHDPIIRPPRKPTRLDIDFLDRRESPTNVSPVGPGAAWLAPFLHAAGPLPALVQSDLTPRPPSLQGKGENVFLASPLRWTSGYGAGGEAENSPLSPCGRTAGYGAGGEGAAITTAPTPMPW